VSFLPQDSQARRLRPRGAWIILASCISPKYYVPQNAVDDSPPILSPGDVICFSTYAEQFAFWDNTVVRSINETISTNFTDPNELEEFYSRVQETDAKLDEFGKRCLASGTGPYLKYIGTTSTIRDLVSLADKIVGPGQPIDYYGYSYGTVIGFHFLSCE